MTDPIYGLQLHRVLKCSECGDVPRCRPTYQDDLRWQIVAFGWLVRKDDFGDIYWVCRKCSHTFNFAPNPKSGVLR